MKFNTIYDFMKILTTNTRIKIVFSRKNFHFFHISFGSSFDHDTGIKHILWCPGLLLD